MLIPFAGTYVFDDLRYALNLRSRLVPDPYTMPFTFVVFGWLGFLIFAFLQDLTRLWVGLLFMAIFSALSVCLVRLSQQIATEQWHATNSIHNALEGTLDVEGVKSDWQDSISFHKWAAFRCHIINDNMILLMTGATSFIFLPRSFFASDEAWTATIALVKEKTPAEPSTTWRFPYARLNARLISGILITMFVGLAVIYSI